MNARGAGTMEHWNYSGLPPVERYDAAVDRVNELRAALQTLHDAVVRHGLTEGDGPAWLKAFQDLMTAVRGAADVIAATERTK